MTDQIFISYSKNDSDFTHKLADDLEAAGFKIWIDKSIGGGDLWRETIEKNLKAAGDVIIVISPNSMASEWVKHEGSLAYGWGKQLFPVLIEPVENLPPWLEEYQWVDFVNAPHKIAFDALIAALTPPNPIQDLLEREIQTYRQTGDLISDSILRVIEEEYDSLTINEEAKNLLYISKQAIETQLQKEHQTQLELEKARRQREQILYGVGIASAILVLLMSILLNSVGPHPTASAPNGMISIDLAGDENSLKAILDSLDKLEYFRIGLSFGLEFLFIIIYSTALALACLWAARKYREFNQIRLSSIGRFLSYAMLLAGLLDLCENIALISVFFDNPLAYAPQIAMVTSTGKFILIFLGFLYIILGLAIKMLHQTKILSGIKDPSG